MSPTRCCFECKFIFYFIIVTCWSSHCQIHHPSHKNPILAMNLDTCVFSFVARIGFFFFGGENMVEYTSDQSLPMTIIATYLFHKKKPLIIPSSPTPFCSPTFLFQDDHLFPIVLLC